MNIDIFMRESARIARICSNHSYMDKDFCEDETGHRCPYSERGGCVFSKQWDILPCEILKRI